RLRRRHRRLRSEPDDHARREDAAHESRLQPVRRASGDRRDRYRPVAWATGHRERQVRGETRQGDVSEASYAVMKLATTLTNLSTREETEDGRLQRTS